MIKNNHSRRLCLFLCTEKVSTFDDQSVCLAVYTITFERRVRWRWNFLHSLVLIISRTSLKMTKDWPDRSSIIAKILIFLCNFLYENRPILPPIKTSSHHYIPFDREFHELQNSIENKGNKLSHWYYRSWKPIDPPYIITFIITYN